MRQPTLTLIETQTRTPDEVLNTLGGSISNDTYGILLDVQILLTEAQTRCELAQAQVRPGSTYQNPLDEVTTALEAVGRALPRL